MDGGRGSPDSRRGSPGGWVLAGLLLVVGLFSTFYPTLLSGFDRLQQDLGDPRLVNYLLEHGFRWVGRWPGHTSLWDPPFYYPAANVGALHDALLALGPLYWPWRVLGLLPDTAFQLFMLTVSVLNFWVAWLFMRSALSLSPTASAGAAYLFAFANPRTARMLHQQLVAGFLPVLAVLALVMAFRAPDPVGRRRWLAAFFLLWVAQMWAGFYWGWYLVLALFVAGVWALFGRSSRTAVFTILEADFVFLAAGLVVSGALVAPMILHHLDAAAQVGLHDFSTEVLPRTARWASWLYMGTPNLPYGLLQEGPLFSALPVPVEQQLGLGIGTSAVALWGLWTARSRPLVRAFLWTGVALVLVSTVLYGEFTLWKWVHAWVPGAKAIRAPARTGLVLLLPLAAGFGLAQARLEARGSHLIAALLLGVCLVEQVRFQPSFDKLAARSEVAEVVAAVPEGCEAFYAVTVPASTAPLPFRPWKYHLDAMWAGLELERPTVNGYSGFRPAGWAPLYDNVNRGPDDRARIDRSLAGWLGGNLEARVCVVEMGAP